MKKKAARKKPPVKERPAAKKKAAPKRAPSRAKHTPTRPAALPDSLDALRDRIRALDEALVRNAAERVALARKVGEQKRRDNRPTVDYAQERIVLDRARAAAGAHGLDPRTAEDLLASLIRAAVTAQDEDSLRHGAEGKGKRAVVVGGAGRMGRWLDRFLSAQGFATDIVDPAADESLRRAGERSLPTAELIVCSTPPRATAALYEKWRARPPKGVVVDIASIKTPLIEPIRALQAAGGRVASIHPMFGPSMVLLRDADVVICEAGDAAAEDVVERLFRSTTANVIRMPITEHDGVMADLLSLAHATAIAFALALPASEHPVHSTTFSALERLASAVVRESPDVYYEIQAMNPHSTESLERLREAVERVIAAVKARDSREFHSLLTEGRRRTGGG